MATRLTGPRPRPLLLLIACLLGVQWAALTAAQTAGQTTGQTTSQTAAQTTGQTTGQITGQTTAQTTAQTTSQTTAPAHAQTTSQTTSEPSSQPADQATEAAWPPSPGPAWLTTGEREALCQAATALQRSPGDTEDSSRTRRSSEWSPERRSGAGPDGCPTSWDGALCWPATGAGRNRSLPCFHEFHGILYNPNEQVSRVCRPDGVWSSSTNYSACRPLPHTTLPLHPTEQVSRVCRPDGVWSSSTNYSACGVLPLSHQCTPQQHAASASIEATSVIYLTGYSASLVTLVAATAIFRHFKELHCPRNIIHTNLFVACMANDVLWIAVMTIELAMAGATPTSCGLVVLLHYFHVATFFWMFVEGLNLYMMVVETFTVDRVRLYLYPLIGWGLPLVAVTAWSIVRAFTAGGVPAEVVVLSAHQSCSVVGGNHSFVRGLEPPLEQSFFSQCPWLEASEWDWIHIGPSLLGLACNVVFLVRIMCVLITKLRSTNSAATQQYKKATKALLVLMPLLGVTYILVLVSPSTTHVIYYIQAVLVSTQGLVVSLLYCFCNAEVQLTLRKHWRRRRGKTYLSPADAHRARPEEGTSRLKAAGDTSATDLTNMTAMESDAV